MLDALRAQPIAARIWLRGRDGAMYAVRRLTAHIWHVERDGRPIRAGSAVQVATFMEAL
jgi:hypothetical protein